VRWIRSALDAERTGRRLAVAAALAVAASVALAEPSPTPTAAKSHARTAKGIVASVAPDGKSLTVRDEHGRESHFVVTSATRVSGGALETGRKVTVRWMPLDKKNVATAVRVQSPEPERTASTAAPAPPNPTPNRP